MKKKEQAPVEAPLRPATAPRITAEDIQAKEFRIARLRGYKERDVDEFLDELTLAWGALLDENRRLRSQAGFGAAAIGAPDLDDAARQADEIVARARREAARILAEAGAAAGPRGASGDDRSSVSAFLTRERTFLQELATLVQGHAEGVKGMAREVFAKPAAVEPATEPAPADEPPAPAPKEVLPTHAETSRVAASVPDADDEDEPIRIEEPAPASVRTSEAEETGDRSLKELFWGED
jgi:DivIVA domain-containing protein